MIITADFHKVLVIKPDRLDAVAATWTTSALTWLMHVQGGGNVLCRMLLIHTVFLYPLG